MSWRKIKRIWYNHTQYIFWWLIWYSRNFHVSSAKIVGIFTIFGERECLRVFVPWVFHNIQVRVVSHIQSFAFGSCLYIRYKTAAHIVNSNSSECHAWSGAWVKVNSIFLAPDMAWLLNWKTIALANCRSRIPCSNSHHNQVQIFSTYPLWVSLVRVTAVTFFRRSSMCRIF